MTIIQFNSEHDANLNVYEEQLARVIKTLEESQRHFDSFWKAIFTEFDRAQGSVGAPARFVCQDGYVLSREVSNLNADPVLDAARLQEVIFRYFSKAEAEKVWTAITEPVKERRFSQDKLERAIKAGKVPVELAQQALVAPKQITSRHRRPATADDLALFVERAEPAAEA